jgi:3-oxoacyl-[acyl-carrier-protein] synthase-3
MGSYIKGISYYLPKQKLTNEELCTLFPDLTEEGIVKRTGIRSRHISAPDEISSDLAYESALLLFEEYCIGPEEIDFLILCAEVRDYTTPPSACVLQNRLGMRKNIGAFDVPLGCTGFVYGLGLSKALLETHQFNNVLLLTSEVTTKVIHPEDQQLRMIFGDGAAATLVSNNKTRPESAIHDFVYGTDGGGAPNLRIEHGAGRKPLDLKWMEDNEAAGGMRYGTLNMKGVELFIFAMRVVPPMVDELLNKEGCTMNDIDLFVFHQANGYLLEVLRKKLNIPTAKFFVWIEEVGNTVSASIPIALKEAMKAGKAKEGDKILLASFGIGYSWSGSVIQL